jgi:alpha-L-fucosidase
LNYRANKKSLADHPLPDWFDRAKLGIFVHWGLYSLPAWAPTSGESATVAAQKGWKYWFENNAYAEWYWNSMRVPGSATQSHHHRTYGDLAYEGFAPRFGQAAAGWRAEEWAGLFARAGARYAVMVTKHHDGYLLWPSAVHNPRKNDWQSRRDYVGEFTAAMRAQDLEVGLYYSGGLDWTFEPGPVLDFGGMIACVPSAPAYAQYATAHWRELIERYEPRILWNDIGYPGGADLPALFADYYNRFPDGLVNDRFSTLDLGPKGSLKRRILLPVISRLAQWMIGTGTVSAPSSVHADYTTPEYAVFKQAPPKKWESTRGLGLSFGYNQAEGEEHCLPAEKLVHTFIDIVSKGGNLLLNVGPDAAGRIPTLQRSRLEALGDWMTVNSEGIYSSRPWTRAEGTSADGQPLRFTTRAGQVYAFLLAQPGAQPGGRVLRLPGLAAQPGSEMRVLGRAGGLTWRQEGDDLVIELPPLAPAPAYTFRFIPAA